MKFQAQKDNLLRATQAVQNVISAQSSLPILSNILLEVKKNKLKLTATDLDIGISCIVPVEAEQEGMITLPAKKFSDIIRELAVDIVDIEVKKNFAVNIAADNSFFKLMGISKDEFPKLPAFNNREFIKIPQAELRDKMEMCAFAVSRDETRYILNGVLFELKEDRLRLVATDGRRLAMVQKNGEYPKKIDKKVIVPHKTVIELIRNLGDEGEVKIIFGENQICFEFDDITVTSRLIEGEFPDYEQVMPKQPKEKAKILRTDFLKAVKRVALFSNPDSLAIKIDILKDKLVLSKSAPELGEARDEIKAEYGGSELSIGFNPNYLLDVLKSITDEIIELELSGEQKPAVIRDKDKYLYIILPMQLA